MYIIASLKFEARKKFVSLKVVNYNHYIQLVILCLHLAISWHLGNGNKKTIYATLRTLLNRFLHYVKLNV